MQTLKKLLFLLTPYERKRAGLLLVMILIMAILDTIGVASILPFIAVLTNPELIETNLILNSAYQFLNKFGVENDQQFLFALGVIVFIIVFLFGHTFNFLINALGAYVHSSRLQYIEFFGKFYKGGGKAFTPLAMNTKYHNLKNEEAV